MPRRTFTQTFACQQAAFQRAMLAQRLDRILRAAWVETAVLSKKWADTQLVAANQQRQKCFHLFAFGKDCDACDANKRVNSSLNKVFKAAVVAGSFFVLTGCDRRTIQSINIGRASCRDIVRQSV